jgi:hypothetical protein
MLIETPGPSLQLEHLPPTNNESLIIRFRTLESPLKFIGIYG